VLGIKDGKKRFADLALAMSKAFTLCCTLDEAKAVREEVAFFQAVKVILTKREITRRRRRTRSANWPSGRSSARRWCRKRWSTSSTPWVWTSPTSASSTTPSWPRCATCPSATWRSNCWSGCSKARSSHALPATWCRSKKFSDMLADVVQRYQNRSIEAAQVMEELVQMAKKFREAAARGEQLGLTEDEVRFYDALANNESAVRELTDETLKKIAHELAENLRKNLTVDWSARESVQAKLRLMVKRILRKYKYPPDQQEAAVELVLQQAKALGEAWS
jgi:type I restriction enzyme R subunit